MYLAVVFTAPVSLAGLPAISVPCGYTQQDLPIGLQLLAPPFCEALVVLVAAAFVTATDFHTKKPALE
jgi:aspartyl-tRNA(Asn)/glutamyl-tRNA(Gln) amidotransferase subunit A